MGKLGSKFWTVKGNLLLLVSLPSMLRPWHQLSSLLSRCHRDSHTHTDEWKRAQQTFEEAGKMKSLVAIMLLAELLNGGMTRYT